ncbi:hypothetical protein B0H11DRAFT_2387230 [Mycena galericulata]|nr:hypothetical protein B0H11DRAFT_2387230 [Mycena galericulata]
MSPVNLISVASTVAARGSAPDSSSRHPDPARTLLAVPARDEPRESHIRREHCLPCASAPAPERYASRRGAHEEAPCRPKLLMVGPSTHQDSESGIRAPERGVRPSGRRAYALSWYELSEGSDGETCAAPAVSFMQKRASSAPRSSYARCVAAIRLVVSRRRANATVRSGLGMRRRMWETRGKCVNAQEDLGEITPAPVSIVGEGRRGDVHTYTSSSAGVLVYSWA